jgi:hypothetical protein
MHRLQQSESWGHSVCNPMLSQLYLTLTIFALKMVLKMSTTHRVVHVLQFGRQWKKRKHIGINHTREGCRRGCQPAGQVKGEQQEE